MSVSRRGRRSKVMALFSAQRAHRTPYQAASTPLPLERSPPASFKRLLNCTATQSDAQFGGGALKSDATSLSNGIPAPLDATEIARVTKVRHVASDLMLISGPSPVTCRAEMLLREWRVLL